MGGRGVPLSAAQPAVRAAGPLEGGGQPRPAGAAGRAPDAEEGRGGARRPLGAGPGAERGRRRVSCGEGLRTSRKKETAGGAFASRAPNFAKCVTLRPGRAEVWGHPCWVPGWCGPAFLAHCPLSAPTTRRWPRAAGPASRCSCWRCPPARGCPPGPSRTHVAAALRPRAPGRAQSRATRPAVAAGAATATRSSPSSSDRHGSWSAGPGHASG